MLRRFLFLVAAAALVGVFGAVSASAKPRHAGSCNSHRKHALAVTHRVLVYPKATGNDGLGEPLTTYYVCLRPGGTKVAIGQNATGQGEYPPNITVNRFQIKGTFVAAQDSSGAGEAAACSKFQTTGCPSVKNWIEVVDAKARRHLMVPTIAATPLALSSAGALAWIDTATPSTAGVVLRALVLHRGPPHQLAGSIQTVATGTVDLHSLHLDGLTLHWTESGQARQVTLH